jgi:aminotransferase EvaB
MMASQIPLFSPKIANNGVDLAGALQRVVERNWYVLGTEVPPIRALSRVYRLPTGLMR